METTLVYIAVVMDALALLGAIQIFFRMNINQRLFMDQIKKLLQAGNRERAIKLCAVAPNAVGTQGVEALLRLSPDGFQDTVTLKETFDRAEGKTMRKLSSAMLMALLGGLASIALVVPALLQWNSTQVPRVLVVEPLAMGALGIAAYFKGQILIRGAEREKTEIVTLLIASGENNEA